MTRYKCKEAESLGIIIGFQDAQEIEALDAEDAAEKMAGRLWNEKAELTPESVVVQVLNPISNNVTVWRVTEEQIIYPYYVAEQLD